MLSNGTCSFIKLALFHFGPCTYPVDYMIYQQECLLDDFLLYIYQAFARPLQGGLLGIKKKCIEKVSNFNISF